MMIRHSNKLKLDSTHKACAMFVVAGSGRIRWQPFPGCRTTQHQPTQPRVRGMFEPPMQACHRVKGGMSQLRHYHQQPHETHRVIQVGKRNHRCPF